MDSLSFKRATLEGVSSSQTRRKASFHIYHTIMANQPTAPREQAFIKGTASPNTPTSRPMKTQKSNPAKMSLKEVQIGNRTSQRLWNNRTQTLKYQWAKTPLSSRSTNLTTHSKSSSASFKCRSSCKLSKSTSNGSAKTRPSKRRATNRTTTTKRKRKKAQS